KRIRPAPMGRAFRVVKRTAHLTVRVAERPLEIAAVGSETAPKAVSGKRDAGVSAAPKAKAPARKGAAPKKKKTAAKKSAPAPKKK
ncbi:MAG TPA: hypothetical protein VFO48_11680, partial [Vicinamibacterales bacterium]|nr:hypothetical protein [Vicinamibacterales bacterium]